MNGILVTPTAGLPLELSHWWYMCVCEQVMAWYLGKKAITWTSADILNWILMNKLSEISLQIQTFSVKKIHLKISSAKGRPLCFNLSVIKEI